MFSPRQFSKIPRHCFFSTTLCQVSRAARSLSSSLSQSDATQGGSFAVPSPPNPADSLRAFYGEEFTTPGKGKELKRLSLDATVMPTALSLVEIRRVIESECDAPVSVYVDEGGVDSLTPANLVLQLATGRERITLAESLMRKFRRLLGGGEIGCEGLEGQGTDWIIIDLVVATVHIFDPQARINYNLDAKFAAGRTADAETADEVYKTISRSLPRKIAGDPSRPDPSDEMGRERHGGNPFLR